MCRLISMSDAGKASHNREKHYADNGSGLFKIPPDIGLEKIPESALFAASLISKGLHRKDLAQ